MLGASSTRKHAARGAGPVWPIECDGPLCPARACYCSIAAISQSIHMASHSLTGC
jgi:hypothetical protein